MRLVITDGLNAFTLLTFRSVIFRYLGKKKIKKISELYYVFYPTNALVPYRRFLNSKRIGLSFYQ